MLLQDLHDRHACNSLLVAESEEDIWKTESVYRKRLNTSDGETHTDACAGSPFYPFLHLSFMFFFLLKIVLLPQPNTLLGSIEKQGNI